jgi:hypothetical protein
MTAGRGQLDQDRQNKSVMHDFQGTMARTVLSALGCQQKAARIRQPGRTERRGQPEKDG